MIDRRGELHLTQQQLAAAAGLQQSVISRIEQGSANPPPARSAPSPVLLTPASP
ncbi:MAG: helix-turn-helix domain-containing protein [Thermoleophilia bacterium]